MGTLARNGLITAFMITYFDSAIWYHLYNLKIVKNTHRGALFLRKLQTLARITFIILKTNLGWRSRLRLKHRDKRRYAVHKTGNRKLKVTVKITCQNYEHIQVTSINKIGAPCHQLDHLKHVVIERPALPSVIKMKIELINQTLASKLKP